MVSVRRSRVVAIASVSLLSAAVLIPASMTFAAEASLAPRATAELPLLSPDAPSALQLAGLAAIENGRLARAAQAARPGEDDADTAPTRTAAADLDDETVCMAKVVHHEAGNQPRAGQLAVAQTILNRVESGRFAASICGVVHQRNQYFDTTRYHPREDSAAWAQAVAVALEARSEKTPDIVPGALFFRAGYAPQSSFFRNRVRVAALGDHVFYR